MKKNILKVTLVAAFALIAGYNVYNSQKSDAIVIKHADSIGLRVLDLVPVHCVDN